MLVELSPWDVVKTSIRLPSKTARRQKPEGTDGLDFPFGASFVTKASLRSKQKRLRHAKNAHDMDRLPLLTITSSHRVAVIGRSMKDGSHKENSSMQYASRPGIASNFIYEPKNGQSTKECAQISALLDAKNDRVYAFQHNNARLCSWHAYKSGGPDSDSSLRVGLRQRALSISLLPIYRGVVYGTCADGCLYFARVVQTDCKGDSIAVEYLSSIQFRHLQYIGTVADVVGKKSGSAAKKRKASDPEISLTLYQVFCDENAFIVVRHDVLCGGGERLLFGSTHETKTTRINVPLTIEGKLEDWRIEKANLMVSSSGLSPKIVLSYALRHKHDTGNSEIFFKRLQFCASLSLSDASFLHYPLPLPSTIRQAQLVMESLLVVATDDRILLFDLKSGVTVNEVEIACLFDDSTERWLLCADARLSTMAVIFPQNGHLHAAFASTRLEGSESPLAVSKLTLSNRMSTSKTQLSRSDPLWSKGTRAVRDIDACSLYEEDIREDSTRIIQKALGKFDSACQKILHEQESLRPGFLVKSYDETAAALNRCFAQNGVSSLRELQQDAAASAFGTKSIENCRSKGYTAEVATNYLSYNNQMNGSYKQQGGSAPSALPRAFVDGAVISTLSILLDGIGLIEASNSLVQGIQIEAGLILSRLLRTKKVSARVHLEVGNSSHDAPGRDLKSVLLSLKSVCSSSCPSYSPVNFIYEIIQWCSDISERQMVTMLNYVLCYALADDVAEAFMTATYLPHFHPGKILSKRYCYIRDKIETSVLPESGYFGSKLLEPDELSKLSRALILQATSFLLQRFSLYSQCNEAMLRAAFVEGLTRRQAILVVGLLADLISYPSSSRLQHVPACTCRWISALSDCYRDVLMESNTKDGSNRFSSLHRILVRTVDEYEAVLSLQDDVTHLHAGPRKKKASKLVQESQARKKAKKKETEEDIPGYTVDHLSF